jgi:hypothetical protein
MDVVAGAGELLAQAMPAGPEPTTATFLPVLSGLICGVIQPSSQPLSTMAHSIVLMVTGCPRC